MGRDKILNVDLSCYRHIIQEDITFIDAFYASTDWSDMPMSTAVEAEGKLASTWAKLKQQQ